MKKNLLITGAVLCGACLSLLNPTGAVVSAAEASSATSEASITLSGGSTTPTPIDSGETINSEDGEVTGNSGPLSIDYVPNFIFGDVSIGGGTTKVVDQNSNPFVQVSDHRGTGAGWSLKLAATPFINNDVEGEELLGTEITLKNMIPEAVDANNVSGAPTTNEQTFGTSDMSSKVIMNAKGSDGMGSWKGKFQTLEGENSVELTIPTGNKMGSYTSTLTWSLSDAPE
ncbi:WxL domain-containing protein [Listeria booriae]|uniref:WxL domain-containing protein n=1 Tax=Listeria booriae TaxID=1552123 RepID=A0A841YRX4_9LIST|nr:WxL domain-containing protein [Listeria booriae]MBC1403149.1 WxL domain-containing protein [Listeria booriae]MBC1617895.1 WxL domain-containing protein [Listeria booriae]